MDNPYPITITRVQIIDADACEEGIAAFDQAAPGGTLTIPDVSAHVALLSSPLAAFEAWAIETEIVPPIVASVGDYGTATAGYRGTATAGDYGSATAGYRGSATVGDGGTATAGYGGTATAGHDGTATAGDYGTATAGYGGTIIVKWWDGPASRYRFLVGYVGEGGIKVDTAYRVAIENGRARFVEVK